MTNVAGFVNELHSGVAVDPLQHNEQQGMIQINLYTWVTGKFRR